MRILSTSASFDETWPQPFENSQRMWSFDRTVTIEKPLVTFPWRSIGFYALTSQSVITFKKELVKETIVEALEEICEQSPVGLILLVADNYGSHHAKITQHRADELGIEFVFIPPYSPTLNAIEPRRNFRSIGNSRPRMLASKCIASTPQLTIDGTLDSTQLTLPGKA